MKEEGVNAGGIVPLSDVGLRFAGVTLTAGESFYAESARSSRGVDIVCTFRVPVFRSNGLRLL